MDGERKPAMGYIYEAIDRAKETIKTTFKEKEVLCDYAFDIIIEHGDFNFIDRCMPRDIF